MLHKKQMKSQVHRWLTNTALEAVDRGVYNDIESQNTDKVHQREKVRRTATFRHDK